MKVYTKKGDDGTTSLLSGKRTAKITPKIKAVGALDELNSFVGVVESKSNNTLNFETLQWDLFNMGAMVINDNGMELETIEESDIADLEYVMDLLQDQLPPLKNFILPRGSELVTALHICRSVCRRAEIACIEADADEIIVKYLNRLSDYFFVLARYTDYKEGGQETLWKTK
jgi:cob(I)alamin adenosyltransferase